MRVDVIIPTLKQPHEVVDLVEDIEQTAGMPVRVYATCQQASASVNRNAGLSWSESDPLIMCDDDITGFPDGWAKTLSEAILARPDCMMMAARLMRPDGTFGFMMGWDGRGERDGIFATSDKKLCTACIVMRRTDLRFEEGLIGSGYEDNDICYQIQAAYPNAEFCVHCGVQVVHKNEMKNQRGHNWTHNQAFMQKKWGHL